MSDEDPTSILTIYEESQVEASLKPGDTTIAFHYESLKIELYSDADLTINQEIYTGKNSDLLAIKDEVSLGKITADQEYTSIRAIYTPDDGSPAMVKEYPYIQGNTLVISKDAREKPLPFAISVNVINPLSNCEPQTHEVPIAYIAGEVSKLEGADVIEISFQKWCIKWCDFLKMFYNCSNDFKVGQHLKCEYQKLIAFNHQREHCFNNDKLSTVLPYCLPFNLKDKVIDTWTQELKEKDNCKSIDRCSLMKLTKELNQLRTIADMYKLCKLKVESISRVDLVEEIIKCYANPRDKFCFNISVQINPESGGLTPILLNFKYEVSFANERQYFELDPTGQQLILNYNMVLCPPKCECCKPKFLCKDACRCLPGIDNYTNPPEGK
jgi:hypothetical protein